MSKFESYAITVHQATSHNSNEAIMLSHEIKAINGKMQIGAGRGFSSEDKSRIFELMEKEVGMVDFTFLSEKVLALSRYGICFYREAKPCAFWVNKTFEQSCKIKAPCPRLVFKVRNGRLSVVALRGNGRPRGDEFVCHAPFGNISGGTAMCFNNSLPARPEIKDCDVIERGFFESPFTEYHRNGGIRGVEDWQGHVAFWESVKEDERFNEAVLSEIRSEEGGLRLREWIESV